MAEFLARLKQRKLVQWGLAYIAAAFALIQVVDVVATQFGWPESLRRGITLALGVGFLVTLVIAWYHGEKGRQRVSGAELLLIALVLAIGGGVLWRFARVIDTSGPDAAQQNPGAIAAAPAIPIPAKSVAVLPLSNDSGDKGQQYFSDGLSEDLINALSQFAGLKVISRNSAFRFRDSKLSSAAIGQALGVAHLLEGSVQKLGDQVRISAELVNATDGSTEWSQHYDRPYKDLFKLQDEIVAEVAAQLRARLLPVAGAVVQSDRPPSGSLEAYNAYLHGNQFAARDNEADYLRAIEAYSEAVRIDPRYAQAYAAMSVAKTALAAEYYGGNKAHEMLAAARHDADTALQIDPENASGHRALGRFRLWGELDWTAAEKAYAHALQLDPADPAAREGLAEALASLGRKQEAIAMFRQVLRSDPYNLAAMQELALLLPPVEAEPIARRALQIQPDSQQATWAAVQVFVSLGKLADARAIVQGLPQSPLRDWTSALVEQAAGTPVDADAALKRLIERDGSFSAYQIAEMYAIRKDPDNMFEWLERAWADRDPGLDYLLFDRHFDAYRDDPRFIEFRKKVGLPTTPDAKALP